MSNFDIVDKVAVYRGEIEPAEIALSIFSAHEAAKTETIEQFIVAIPNTRFTIISEIARIVGSRGLVDQNGSDGVTLKYTFMRTVIVTMSGAPTLSQSVPESIDLAHRRVVGGQSNGVESI
jgi:hypothetical protein